MSATSIVNFVWFPEWRTWYVNNAAQTLALKTSDSDGGDQLYCHTLKKDKEILQRSVAQYDLTQVG